MIQVLFALLWCGNRSIIRYKNRGFFELASNEFRQLEILNGENPQSPFKMGGESKWQQQKYGKYKRD